MNDLMTMNGNGGNSLTATDPAAVAAAEAAKARIQAAYIMALHKPRNADQARDRILHACKRPGFAERVEYSKPVGGKAIKGPSIRFAEVALREWQNVMVETQTIYEDEWVRRVKVFVTDLETNATFSKEIQISKTVERKSKKDREIIGERLNSYNETVYIVKATDDEITNKEAAQISKVIRNEGLRLIPQDIIDEALDAARKTLSARDAKDPDAAKKALLDGFSEIGVKPLDIERFLRHKTDSITPAELHELRTMYRAIRDGEARWVDYLTKAEEDTSSAAAQAPTGPTEEELAQIRVDFEDAITETLEDYMQYVFPAGIFMSYAEETAKAQGKPVHEILALAAASPENTKGFINMLIKNKGLKPKAADTSASEPKKTRGKKSAAPAVEPDKEPTAEAANDNPAPAPGAATYYDSIISTNQAYDISKILRQYPSTEVYSQFHGYFGIDRLANLPKDRFKDALCWLHDKAGQDGITLILPKGCEDPRKPASKGAQQSDDFMI
ncbi:MAG TPA: hypothetical protein PLT33_13705 [Deltaproteobacteria bacterium]|nr:hypothetical protein [Deltaproteobacteria bacterium]HQO61911.1 hypothetical protein [Deltaproteobacteria bacterium]